MSNTPTSSAQVAEGVALPPLDAEGLPPLPSNVAHVTRRIRRCESDIPAQLVLEHFAMEYARSAIAPYAERIRQLERELATFKGEHATQSPQSIGNDPEFRKLFEEYDDAITSSQIRHAMNALIAYIDGRTAGPAVPDPFVGQRFLNWNRSQEKPPVAIGKELGVARKVMEIAAAPKPQEDA